MDDTKARAGLIGIGEISKRTGVHIETIRYYERVEVLAKPLRTESGRRVYDATAVKRLAFVARSRQLGFSLKEIRSMLQLVDGAEITCADVRRMTLDHAADARRKIADLRKLERKLSEMAAQCHGDRVPDCPIVDALFGED